MSEGFFLAAPGYSELTLGSLISTLILHTFYWSPGNYSLPLLIIESIPIWIYDTAANGLNSYPLNIILANYDYTDTYNLSDITGYASMLPFNLSGIFRLLLKIISQYFVSNPAFQCILKGHVLSSIV